MVGYPPPGVEATSAVGTHPTGMLSCFYIKKKGGQDIVVPNVREISHFDGHVDVDGPEIRSLRVTAQDVLEHRLPTLRFSHFVLQLRKLTQNLYI